MIIAEITIVPLGTGTSISKYVAKQLTMEGKIKAVEEKKFK